MAEEKRTSGPSRLGCEYLPTPRPRPRRRPAAERLRDFEPVDLGFDDAAAPAAAERCFGTSICRACEVCVLICPDLCITRDPDSGQIRVDLDYCKGCGLCAHYCPKGALKMQAET